MTFFSLCKRFTALRNETVWLQEYSFTAVRATLKYMANSWRAFFKHSHKGHRPPKVRSRNGSTPSFTIPEAVRIKDGKLLILRGRLFDDPPQGGNPYPDCVSVKVVVQQKVGRWYATLCYKIEAIEISDSGVAAGIDRNCGQVTYTTSAGGKGMIYQPKVKRKTARFHRYQRRLARQQKGSNRRKRTKRRIQRVYQSLANTRKNANHQASRRIESNIMR